MSRAMNWARATQRDKVRADAREWREQTAPARAAKARVRTRQAATSFALEHDLACFKCGREDVVFAKSGTNARGAWAICVDCVEAREQHRVAVELDDERDERKTRRDVA